MIEFKPIHGRLASIRFENPITTEEVEGLLSQIISFIGSMHENGVFVVDGKSVDLLAPEIADALIELMRSDNPSIERTGILINESATFGMQVDRMLREAGNPARRSFRNAHQLITWLNEVLDKETRLKLREFF